MPTELRRRIAIPLALMFAICASGCSGREAWLMEICDQESGFERGTGQVLRHHTRIPTDSVMIDPHFAGNGQGPVITWMAERGFTRVEIWERASNAPLLAPVSRVQRYSIGPVTAHCIPMDRPGWPEVAAKLGLNANTCVRHETDAAPSARYALALHSAEETPTLIDRLIGQRAARHRYALIDRDQGKTIASIDSGAIYGTRGMFSPRGNSCDRGAEVSAMSQLLQAPSDRRPWWEVVPTY